MINFLTYIDSQNYYVNIGEEKLSILSQASIGLACLYADSIENLDSEKPLIIGFPNKGWATVWLSLGLLVNYFQKDVEKSFQSNVLDEIKSGETVKILRAKAKWIKTGKFGSLQFKEGARQTINPTWIPFIEKHNGSPSLTKYSTFANYLKTQRNNLRPIERILNYKRGNSLGINKKYLTSEIMIVVGRGDKGNFTQKLKETKIYDESLSIIFSLGTNIRIENDLENIGNVLDKGILKKIDFYKIRIKQFATKAQDKDFDDFIELYENDNITTQTFKDAIENFLMASTFDIIEEVRYFHDNHFPGVVEDKLENLKCIIIHEPSIALEYNGLIETIIKEKRIPILITSDLLSNFSIDDLYEKNWLRYFWSISKINGLKKIEENDSILDFKLWEKATNYTCQSIDIEIYNQSESEKLLQSIITTIIKLPGYEVLKKNFWNIIYPAYYIFKNSISSVLELKNFSESIVEFEKELERVSNETNKGLISNLMNFCNHLRMKDNSKAKTKAKENSFCLTQSIPFNGTFINIPETKTTVIKDSLGVITGLPFKEKYNRRLKNFVIGNLPKEILILAWQNEANYIEHYIFSEYRKSIYIDNIKEIYPFNNLLESEADIDQELSELIFPRKAETGDKYMSEDMSYDFIESTYREARHGEYFSTDTDVNVKVKIINFTNGDWYYLPVESKMRAITYDNEHKLKLSKYYVRNISRDMQILKYKIGNEQLRILGRNTKSITLHFKNLDIWRISLRNSYENCSRNMQSLEKLLLKIKDENGFNSNPNRQNIRRWLADENLLSPEGENLLTILKSTKQENHITNILDAKKNIRAFDNHIRKFIKDKMTNILSKRKILDNEDFVHDYKGHKIEAFVRRVAFVEKNPVEVPFKYCNKIISDHC